MFSCTPSCSAPIPLSIHWAHCLKSLPGSECCTVRLPSLAWPVPCASREAPRGSPSEWAAPLLDSTASAPRPKGRPVPQGRASPGVHSGLAAPPALPLMLGELASCSGRGDHSSRSPRRAATSDGMVPRRALLHSLSASLCLRPLSRSHCRPLRTGHLARPPAREGRWLQPLGLEPA